ncbi:transposase [Paenibacillus lentus]|uniref:Transposase n=1 Tax=Paenibacillus lentus TaxID=1338368 RepID=A0A3Q8SAL6_9BACL|nr:transposase [Paenibacillus lentus]
MHRIDEIYTPASLFWLSTNDLVPGFETNRKRVRRLMQLMALEAIYPKPNLINYMRI